VEPTQEQIDSIYRDRILRARRMPLHEKLLGGAALFDEVCERMRTGIRFQRPDADDKTVNEILRKRISALRRLEEHGIYRPAEARDGRG
jgi:hypothetical protein